VVSTTRVAGTHTVRLRDLIDPSVPIDSDSDGDSITSYRR
jgi:hypothetical protein